MTTTVDVIVVGAGILGVATARTLTRFGLRVALLDAIGLRRGGTAFSAGNLHIQGIHTRRPGQSVPVNVRRLLPLQRAASSRWADWVGELDLASAVVRCGGLMVAETPAQVDDLRVKHGWETEAGLVTEVLDGDAARARCPALDRAVLAATWCADDGFADPTAVRAALLADAQRTGRLLLGAEPVIGIRGGTGWQVATMSQSWSAAAVVDVAGPWLGEVAGLAGVDVGLTPAAIQAYSSAPIEPMLRHLVQHVAEGLSVKQTGDGRIMVGGGWPAAPMRSDGDADVDRAMLRASTAQAARVVPAVAALPVDRAWTGPLAATPDEMPVIGPLPGWPTFLLAGGTYAFTFAPLWASVLAQLVQGDVPSVALDDLGPARLVSAAG